MKNRIKNMKKVSNGGFSMIELIIVVAILLAVVVVVSTSVSLVFKARAKGASSEIESLISRSKVNTLSGRRNRFVISYDNYDKCYYLRLYDITGIKDASGDYTAFEDEPYEEQKVGNQLLDVDILDEEGNALTDILNGDTVTLEFKTGTGRIKNAIMTHDGTDSNLLEDGNTIIFNINFGVTYRMTIYANTGAIESVRL